MTRSARYVWLAVFVTLVFVAGVATGLVVGPRLLGPAGSRLMQPWRPGAGPAGDVLPGPVMPQPLVRRLASELQLDAEQQKKLEDVFATRRERLLGFSREARERFEAEQRELRREITGILTPEQQARFERWLERTPRRRGMRPNQPPL